tara:strand:+ start:111 stop:1271 length:1161 start_codon:yes stop_codon:yes gene_type:complete
MGETSEQALRVDFDSSVKLKFHGAKVTSDAGLLAYRELDEAFRLTDSAAEALFDARRGRNTQHSLTALLRQAVYSRLAGYEDTNNAGRLSVDPAMRQLVGERAVSRQAASASEMSRFETDMLTQPPNLETLMGLSARWIDSIQGRDPGHVLILDLDSSVSPTHGDQEGSAYNGHFGCACYHPLFCFNQSGDLERVQLRNGNVHSADDWRSVLEPVVVRYRDKAIRKFFRGDAAFARPDVYEFLEADRYGYVIRLPANARLYREVKNLIQSPPEPPVEEPVVYYASFSYQADSWDRPRRVIAKVAWHPGELLPRLGFVVTNLTWSPQKVVKFYNRRGTAEQWIKEGKHALNWTRLSCHDFVDNQVRLQLFALAYNLGNFLRRLALPE